MVFFAPPRDASLSLDALSDLSRSDIDVAIRLGAGGWAGLEAEHLLDQAIFPVASPDWARQLQMPADLAKVPTIQEAKSSISWADRFAQAGVINPPQLSGPVFSDPVLAFEAALSGQGAMLAWSLIASDALADGRLSRLGAPMKNLAHSASFDSCDNDAPSMPGIKQLGDELALSQVPHA